MPVIREPVRPVRIRLFCDVHPQTEMDRLPGTLLSNPPQYQFQCPICKVVQTERKPYPVIEYEDDL